jgi:hypothetical protein
MKHRVEWKAQLSKHAFLSDEVSREKLPSHENASFCHVGCSNCSCLKVPRLEIPSSTGSV